MPGLRGTPAGMSTISAPVKHSLIPAPDGSYPFTCLFVSRRRRGTSPHQVSTYGAFSVDVRDIGGDTRSALDIVQRELGHSGVELEEEGQRLANATGSTEDGDFGSLDSEQRWSIAVPGELCWVRRAHVGGSG